MHDDEEKNWVNTDDDGYPTKTSRLQRNTEDLVCSVLAKVDPNLLTNYTRLTRDFVFDGLNKGLDSNFSSLDASRPWLCYWMCHSLALLGQTFESSMINRVITTLDRCQVTTGGYGGGVLQIPHTAPTYASIMTLVTMNTKEAFASIKRGPLYRFLLRLKIGGAFQVHEDGECDTRALYTVLAVACICNLLTPELVKGCLEWIKSTQGFDGGIGGEPGNESHGGYAYCGLASLAILGKTSSSIGLASFTRWLFMRQMELEGGFQGRTNKVVDSCYSFWQGASFALLNRVDPHIMYPNCNHKRLVQYVIGACTHGNGGLKDKPDTHRDFYHTCYALSGLSVVQANNNYVNSIMSGDSSSGDLHSLKETDPVFNVVVDKLGKARAFFARLPSTHDELMRIDW